jgi:hypothetical protein
VAESANGCVWVEKPPKMYSPFPSCVLARDTKVDWICVAWVAIALRFWADCVPEFACSARSRRLCSALCTCDSVLSSMLKRPCALLALVSYCWLCDSAWL